MTLLEICASCGWIWSRSFHSRIVCSRNNSSKSLMLILERLMIDEACTPVPGISWRADKTSNVQLIEEYWIVLLCAFLSPEGGCYAWATLQALARKLGRFAHCTQAEADKIYIQFKIDIQVEDTQAFYVDNLSAEDVKLFLLQQMYKSLPFCDYGYFFVWTAVPSNPSSQPIWLKVSNHCK